MYIVIGKIVVGALFYILVTGVLGLILNACIELGDITDIDFLYFWIIGVFLFALIYAVNY
jgi:hypothetical protein